MSSCYKLVYLKNILWIRSLIYCHYSQKASQHIPKLQQFLYSRWESRLYILFCFNSHHSISSSSIYNSPTSLP